MRAICLLVLFAVSLAAQPFRSGAAASGQNFSVPYTNLTVGDTRIEGEVHAFTPAIASDRAIFADSATVCRIVANSLTLKCWNWNDGHGGGEAQVDLTPYTQFRFRYQRNTGAHTDTLEVWDGQGTNYRAGAKAITIGASPTQSSTVTVAQGPMDIACLRWYSTLVAANSRPPVPAPSTPADQMDFTFENSPSDRSTHGWTMTYTGGSPPGTITYVDTPAFDPIAAFGQWLQPRVFRIGENLSLDGSASFASRVATGVPSSFSWTRTSGPGIPVFGTPNAATTTFSTDVAGTNLIRLTAGDGTANVYFEMKVGGVSADANYIVQGVPANMSRLLGPLLMFGKAPWTFFDWASMADADQIPPIMLRPENIVELGTAITGGPFTLTAANEPHITSASSWTGQITQGQYIIVVWDTIDGTGTGRYFDTVKTINSLTDVTLNRYYATPAHFGKLSLPATVSLYQLKPQGGPCDGTSDVCFFYTHWAMTTNPSNWNFYDRVLALYRLYYRTGIDTYRDYARQIADLWWQWPLDHGAVTGDKRDAALGGIFANALDVHPERIPEFKPWIASAADQTAPWTNVANAITDKRELGYATGFVALGALFDATNRSFYCTDVNAGLVTLATNWMAGQNARGYFNEDSFAGNPGYPAASLAGSPWRQAVTVKALQYAYDALSDPAICNQPTLAASLLTSIQAAATWEYNEGYSSVNRGIYYVVDNGVKQQNAVQGAGTVSTTQGSKTVPGVGTTFQTSGYCDGTHWFAFRAPDGTRDYTYVYRVASCDSNTSATLANNFTQTALSGVQYFVTTTASASCGTGSALNCESGNNNEPNGDRNLTRYPTGVFGWLFAKTGDVAYKTKGDEWFSASFGGPASGPGATDACSGPACDGTVTDAVLELTDCSRHPLPCVSGGTPFGFNAMKNWNEGTGWAAADNYLAQRLGPNPCEYLAFDLSNTSPPYTGGTGQVNVTVADQTCQWTAVSNQGSWLTVTEASGTGNGHFHWTAAANAGSQRSGLVTASAATLTVTQEAAPSGSSVLVHGEVRPYRQIILR